MANLVQKFKYSDLAINPSNGSYSEAIVLTVRVNKFISVATHRLKSADDKGNTSTVKEQTSRLLRGLVLDIVGHHVMQIMLVCCIH